MIKNKELAGPSCLTSARDDEPIFQQLDRIEVDRSQFAAMERVCKLASELCGALDAEAEDVGGNRPSATIVAELGPACDAFEGR